MLKSKCHPRAKNAGSMGAPVSVNVYRNYLRGKPHPAAASTDSARLMLRQLRYRMEVSGCGNPRDLRCRMLRLSRLPHPLFAELPHQVHSQSGRFRSLKRNSSNKPHKPQRPDRSGNMEEVHHGEISIDRG